MAGNGTDNAYKHLDMTPEYNRIIKALTGIRDDIRLLQTLQSDPESGIVTNNVLNDFQRAMVAVSLGGAAGSVAAAIDAGTVSANGGGVADPSGDSSSDLNAERATILAALGVEEDPTDLKVLMREAGFYYWEAQGTAGPDDGTRGSTRVLIPFAQGELLGFDNEVNGQITAGSPSGPPDQIPNPSKPRKRWPFTRPEGSTASQNANPNADLIDPATGQVIARSPEEQAIIDRAGSTPPPAIDYTSGAQ
jgi:hypothetical protein